MLLKNRIMKLKTVRTYAEMKGFSVQYVYQLMREEKVSSVIIDGVKFIKIDKDV